MTLLTHRARPEDVFDAAARLRSHVEGPAGRVEVDVTDLRMILDQIVWSAPDLHDPALDHLAYLRWVLERLDEDERRRCMAWLTDEYST